MLDPIALHNTPHINEFVMGYGIPRMMDSYPTLCAGFIQSNMIRLKASTVDTDTYQSQFQSRLSQKW